MQGCPLSVGDTQADLLQGFYRLTDHTHMSNGKEVASLQLVGLVSMESWKPHPLQHILPGHTYSHAIHYVIARAHITVM